MPPVSAVDPDTNQTGGPTDSFDFTEAMQPAWKMQLLGLDRKRVAGTLSQDDVASWNAIVDAHTPGLSRLTAQPGNVAPMTVPSNSVAQTQQAQLQTYYCGPASAQSIVLAWNFMKGYGTHSMLDGQALSQSALGGTNYTNANASKSTDWGHGDMGFAVDRWLWGSNTHNWYYSQVTPSSASNLSYYVTFDIDNGAMLAASTREPVNGDHYNHHPLGRTILHWVTIWGYYSSGASIRFQDPVYGSTALYNLDAGYRNAAAYFDLSNSWAVKYMTGEGATYGILW